MKERVGQMKWFRELLTMIERLFVSKSTKKRMATAQSRKTVRSVPLSNPPAPNEESEKKTGDTAKALAASEAKSEPAVMPEENEAAQPACASEEVCAQTENNTFVMRQEDSAQEPVSAPVADLETVEAPQSVAAEDVVDREPEDLPAPALQPNPSTEDMEESSQKQTNTLQYSLSDEIVLCTPAAFLWDEEEEAFTLRQKTAEDGSLSSEMMHFRLVRKEPLALPSETEDVWSQNAVQASTLILTPFQKRAGVTKTFVAGGIATTIWEEKQKTEGMTRFVAVILTRQTAYILTGQKDERFSAEQLSECFVLRAEQRDM